MLIHRAYKYEIDPNNIQRTHMYQHAGTARYAWNWALGRIKNKETEPNAIQLSREWNEWKRENATWWNQVSKWAPQAAFQNLQKAFENFFRRTKNGLEKPGFPKFKSKKHSRNSFRLRDNISVDGKYVVLPRLGKLKLKEVSNVKGRILSATITEVAGRWFVSIAVEQEIEVSENQGSSIGVDLGIKNLATLSNDIVISGPKALRDKLLLLRRVNRKLARTKKGSNRRERVKERLARLHYKIACIRRDSLHKLTTTLAKNHRAIGIEDLNVNGMRKGYLARAVSDMGWGEFRRQLEYKTAWYGSELVVHDRFFPSSKICSSCGEKKESLNLNERTFKCNCGLVIDRDYNAAMNLCPGVPRVLDVEAISLFF